MSKAYIISIIVGIAIFMIIFWYNTKNSLEKFDGSPSPATPAPSPAPSANTVQDPRSIKDLVNSLNTLLTSVGSGDVPASFNYTEEFDNIPNKSNLRIYLTTFSDKAKFNETVDIYNPMAQKWNNYMTEDQGFFIVSTQVLPATIKVPNGLALKDKTLNGMRSDEINKADYLLKSFTSTFFLRINSITFTKPEDVIEIFNIFVESPNYVRFTLEPITVNNVISTTNVRVNLQVGGYENKYSFVIPIDTLKSNGNSVVISMVYDGTGTADAKLKLYIGDTEYEKVYTPIPTLQLGNSRIRINGYSNFDATLFSFMYFAAPLSLEQHKDIITYLNKQQSGVSHIISEVARMTEKQLETLRTFVSDQTLTVDDLRDKLSKCTAESAARGPAPEEEFKYNISMLGRSSISTKDLESCSILKIKDRLEKEMVSAPAPASSSGEIAAPGTSPSPSTISAPSAAPSSSQSPSWPFSINVPFLDKVVPKEVDFNKISKGYINRTVE